MSAMPDAAAHAELVAILRQLAARADN